MDHQRQAGFAGGGDMGAEALLLRVARAVVVVVVEPRLADRHHLGMAGARDQVGGADVELLVGVVRMGADRADTRRETARRWRAARPAGAPGSRSSRCGRCPPPARAPTTPSSSSLKSGKSRWQWLSTRSCAVVRMDGGRWIAVQVAYTQLRSGRHAPIDAAVMKLLGSIVLLTLGLLGGRVRAGSRAGQPAAGPRDRAPVERASQGPRPAATSASWSSPTSGRTARPARCRPSAWSRRPPTAKSRSGGSS